MKVGAVSAACPPKPHQMCNSFLQIAVREMRFQLTLRSWDLKHGCLEPAEEVGRHG